MFFSLTYILFFDYLTQLIMTFSHILTLVCSLRGVVVFLRIKQWEEILNHAFFIEKHRMEVVKRWRKKR